MNLPKLIALFTWLLNQRTPFGIYLNSKGDGTIKVYELKGEEILTKTLTDKKD